jgi:hypothetical protein
MGKIECLASGFELNEFVIGFGVFWLEVQTLAFEVILGGKPWPVRGIVGVK